jgi:hypothetical protein
VTRAEQEGGGEGGAEQGDRAESGDADRLRERVAGGVGEPSARSRSDPVAPAVAERRPWSRIAGDAEVSEAESTLDVGEVLLVQLTDGFSGELKLLGLFLHAGRVSKTRAHQSTYILTIT